MKKVISLLLVLTMAAALLVGCGSTDNTDGTTDSSASQTDGSESMDNTDGSTSQTDGSENVDATAPASAVEVLENVWALFGEDEKFFVFGGGPEEIVDNAPGSYDLTDTESLSVQLLVPQDQAANLTEVASLFHGMMLNNFTAGVFRLAEGVDAASFADTLKSAVDNNQWMCGFPEEVVVAVIGDEYVVMAFGLNSVITSFQTKLVEAYPSAEIKYSEAITG